MNSLVLRFATRPRWLALIIVSVLAAALAAAWMGMTQPPGHTSTSYIYGRRVGILDRPNLELENQLNDLVNAVEFPAVFERIERRTQLQSDQDYTFTIERLDESDAIVAIEVRADLAGNTERISRILAEEVVKFVIQRQAAVVSGEIADVQEQVAGLVEQQADLRTLSFNVPPKTAIERIERELALLSQLDEVDPAAELALLDALTVVQPQFNDYQGNVQDINQLNRDLAALEDERLELSAAVDTVNENWYRSITPVEEASNVPLAVAMAFAAAVPTAIVSVGLVLLNLNRRTTGKLIPRKRPTPVAA